MGIIYKKCVIGLICMYTSVCLVPKAHVCYFNNTYYKMMLNDIGVPITLFCKNLIPS
jgi:hypothetical protein